MTVTQHRLHRAIRLQRDRVLHHDGAVEACRQRLDSAVTDLHDAVRERDRAARHLHELIEWHHRTTLAPTTTVHTATYYLRTA